MHVATYMYTHPSPMEFSGSVPNLSSIPRLTVKGGGAIALLNIALLPRDYTANNQVKGVVRHPINPGPLDHPTLGLHLPHFRCLNLMMKIASELEPFNPHAYILKIDLLHPPLPTTHTLFLIEIGYGCTY